jgi:hypothetical protein
MQPRNPGMVRWPVDMQLYASVLFLALTTQVGSHSSRSQDVPRRVTPWHSLAHTSPNVRQYILSSDILSETSTEFVATLESLW